MTVYRVYIGNREYQVDVSDRHITVNGQPVEGNLTALNPNGLYLLKNGSEKRELHVSDQGNSTYTMMTCMHHIVAQVEKKLGRSHKKIEPAAGEVVAPMPGLVVNIAVTEGETVSEGQVLVVLESMKMQMEFRAPFSGLIKKVAIQCKKHVDKGALMVQLAPC